MQWECSRSSSCHTVSGATPVYWGQQGAALQCLPSFSILQLHEPSASLRSHVQTSLITPNTGKHTGENLPPHPKRVLCAAQWGDGECRCSHQWELYGCAEVGSLRGRTRRCVCFLSPSLNRKRHPRLLAHSAAASRAGSDHQRQTGFISHIRPHVDFSFVFFFLFWNTFPKGSSGRLGRNFLEEELRDTCTSLNTSNWALDHKKAERSKSRIVRANFLFTLWRFEAHEFHEYSSFFGSVHTTYTSC